MNENCSAKSSNSTCQSLKNGVCKAVDFNHSETHTHTPSIKLSATVMTDASCLSFMGVNNDASVDVSLPNIATLESSLNFTPYKRKKMVSEFLILSLSFPEFFRFCQKNENLFTNFNFRQPIVIQIRIKFSFDTCKFLRLDFDT